MDFLDIHQQIKLRQHSGEISDARRSADRTTDTVRELGNTVDRLVLAAKAMWELLCEHTELTDEDLLAKVREVDLRDGKLDGKAGTHPVVCSECSRPNSARRRVCLYCGKELPPSSPI